MVAYILDEINAINKILIAIENGLVHVNMVIDRDEIILVINNMVTYKCEN